MKERFGLRIPVENGHKVQLHLGCGDHVLKGWINSDCDPQSDDIFPLDATKLFPFIDNQFDYVFSEHMIEHMTFPQGLRMLNECHRVLKSGGKMRIATPDLRFLIDLYRDDKSELQNAYIKWATDTFIQGPRFYTDTFIINNFFKAWGHKFIYDEGTLRNALGQAGFSHILRRDLNESADEELRGLENGNRLPDGFLKLETMVLEATKP